MHPRPIAETSGPSLPRRRLANMNMGILPFLCAEPPPRLCELKWDREPLVTRCRTRNDRQFGTADPECFGKELDHGLIRGTTRCGRGDPDLELFAPVRACAPAAYPRFRRPRRDANRKHAGHILSAYTGLQMLH